MDELIAHDKTEDQIADSIGADWLIYQELDELIDCVREGNRELRELETCCFSGRYITGDVNPAYLQQLELLRNDQARGLVDEGELEDVGIG